MKYLEARPREELRPFVECVWTASDGPQSSPREPQRILPDGCPELIVHLGDPFTRRHGARWRVQPRAFLAGTLTRPWHVRGGRVVRTLGIRFRPTGAPALLPVSMARARDREMPLVEIVGRRRCHALLSALRAAGSPRAQREATQAWLLDAPRPPTDDLGRRAAAFILEARGQVRIGALAAHCGAGERQVERACLRALGIPPKLFARIVRLNAFLERLGRAERERMADLALEAGYFDQAHLLHDFRALAGRTPARGKAADGALARHFTLPARLRALLDFDQTEPARP